MSSAFQSIIDNAESISFNRRKKVSQTVSRDGVVKSVSLGGQVWEFEVQLPAGPSWSEWRPLIEKIEALDRVSTGTIQINHSGHAWLSGYQGNLTNVTNIVVSNTNTTATNLLNITAGGTGLTPSQYKFRSGDLIQLGSSGRVYSVVEDVGANATSITVNRPIRESTGSFTLLVGQNVSWTVICTSFPKWTIFQRNQISWGGPFVFSEVL